MMSTRFESWRASSPLCQHWFYPYKEYLDYMKTSLGNKIRGTSVSDAYFDSVEWVSWLDPSLESTYQIQKTINIIEIVVYSSFLILTLICILYLSIVLKIINILTLKCC